MFSHLPDPRLPRLIEEARSIEATLAAAAALLDAGRRIDMIGLDQRTGRLCAQGLDLPPEDGARLRPALVTLRTGLDAIACRLKNPPR